MAAIATGPVSDGVQLHLPTRPAADVTSTVEAKSQLDGVNDRRAQRAVLISAPGNEQPKR